MDSSDKNGFAAQLAERFALLPKVVQDAIISADVSKRLRALASTHQLHIDQWETLEQEVQLTLMGLQPLEELSKNLEEALHIPFDQAQPLATDVSRIVFEPIRAELERQLEHPDAKEEEQTDVESAASQILAQQEPSTPTTPAPQETSTPLAVPASAITPPAAGSLAPTTTATPSPQQPPAPVPRTDAATPAYVARAPSHERKAIEGDPYREQLA